MRPPLHVVGPEDEAAGSPQETVAQRIRALQVEARRLALEEARDLAAALVALHAKAAEIHAGGDAFPPGVRAVARDVLLDCESRGQTLEAILSRSP